MPMPPTDTLLLDKEREAKVRPFALKVRAAKGVLTRRMNDAERTIQAVIDKGSITSIDADIQDMRQHLLEVRSECESIVTAYTNLMCVDVPQMTDTYEKNMEEQIEKAITFEREIKKAVSFNRDCQQGTKIRFKRL